MTVESVPWFTEKAHEHEHHQYACRRVVHSGVTRFQSVQILDTFNYGRILVLDGRVQSSEMDEAIYHEALIHPGMTTHPDPRRVLVVGGGEGASMREILRHPSVEKATMVELDEEIIRLARRHLGPWHQGAFDSPKVSLLVEDGRKLLENSDDSYDVIVVDVTDLLDDGPASALYTEEFYRLAKRRLSRPGLVIVQGLPLSPLDYDQHAVLFSTLKAVFPIVRSYKTFIPSFWTDWGFLIASEDLDPLAIPVAELEARIRRRFGNPTPPLGPLTFYDAEEHRALFHIPQLLQSHMQQAGRVLKDADIRPSAAAPGHD